MKQYALEEGHNGVRSNCVNADRIKSGLLNSEMIKNRAKSRINRRRIYVRQSEF